MKALSTEDLTICMLKDKYTRRKFGGVWAINKVPFSKLKNKIMIINTDPHYKKGKHWFCIHFHKKKKKRYNRIEIFCSLGKRNSYRGWMGYFMKKLQRKGIIICNKDRLQSIKSSKCGHYCLLFAILRSRGIKFKSIVKLFKQNNGYWNDTLVKNLIINYFPWLCTK